MDEEEEEEAEMWCHMCSRTVNPPLMEAEIKCPFCASGFVEEMAEEEEPNTSLLPPILMHLITDPSLLRTVEDNQNHEAEAETENEAGGNDVDSQLQEILRRRRGSSSVSVSGVMRLSLVGVVGSTTTTLEEPDENNNGDGGGGDRERRGRLIMVDEYFIGPGFEALLQRLTENDPNRYGTPPALKEAVESLSTVKIQEEEDTLSVLFVWMTLRLGWKPKRCRVTTGFMVIACSPGLSFIVRVRFVGMSCLRMRLRLRTLQEQKSQMVTMVEVCLLLLLLQAAKEVRTVTLLSMKMKRRAMMVIGLNSQSRDCLAACSRRHKASSNPSTDTNSEEKKNMFPETTMKAFVIWWS